MENHWLKLKIILTFLIVILIFTFLILIFGGNAKNAESLDKFAQCLAAKGVTMYGADWCAHCQNEKNRFGDSFRFVPYVECPKEPNKCILAGINGYPTWIFPAFANASADAKALADKSAGGPDRRKLEGEQGLQKLSDESGCKLEVEIKQNSN